MSDLISREALREDLRRFFSAEVLEGIEPKTLFAQIMHDIDNAPTVEAYTPEQVKELVDLNKKLSEERTQGEYAEKYEKILQIVEHWNDKSSSFVSACEAFEKILDVTKGGVKNA